MQNRESFLDGYLDLEQFAALVGRSVRTIRYWMDAPNNALPFRQLGNRRLINLQIARDWLDRGVKPRNSDRRRRRSRLGRAMSRRRRNLTEQPVPPVRR
jgi:hypothetical protein